MTRTSIGEYKVTRRLEEADEVYLARSPKGSNCRIRLLDPPDDPEAWDLARRTASLCSSLDHPAVGRLLDAFVDDDRLALVFDPIDGDTLDRLLQKLQSSGQALDLDAIWYVGHQLAGALAQAHTTSDDDGEIVAVCHGHLTPRAVVVAWNGFMRLDGLGLAPLVTGGSIPVEATFRAPEEAGGGRVTPRGDCYALGMLVWTLVTGEPPRGDTTIDALGARIPSVLGEPLTRALETSVGKRRVTSTELEHAFAELLNASGKSALADAMASLKRGSSLLAKEAAPSAGSSPGRRRSLSPVGMRSVSQRRIPSKQATLLGTPMPAAVRAKMPSRPPAIDWDAASEDAKRPSIPPGGLVDDLGWGGEEQPDAPTTRPAGRDGANARRSVDTVEEIFAQADAAVSALDQVEDLRDAFPGAVTAASSPGASGPGASLPGASRPGASRPGASSPSASRPGMSSPGVSQPGSSQPESVRRPVPRPTASGRGLRKSAESDPQRSEPQRARHAESARPAESEGEIEVSGATAFLDFDDEDFSEPGEPTTPVEPAVEAPIGEAPKPIAQTPAPSPPPLPAEPNTARVEPPRAEPAPPAPTVGQMAPAGSKPIPPQPSAATPWVAQPEEPAASPTRLSVSTAVLITIATAVVVLAFGTWWVRRDSTVVEPVAPSAGTSAPVASAPVPKKPTRRTRPPPPKPVVDTRDGSDLPANQGYLTVKFSKNEGEVYFFTTSQGAVNKKLPVACGTAFVRVGKPEPLGVNWLSEGRPVVVACQKVTEITIEP